MKKSFAWWQNGLGRSDTCNGKPCISTEAVSVGKISGYLIMAKTLIQYKDVILAVQEIPLLG